MLLPLNDSPAHWPLVPRLVIPVISVARVASTSDKLDLIVRSHGRRGNDERLVVPLIRNPVEDGVLLHRQRRLVRVLGGGGLHCCLGVVDGLKVVDLHRVWPRQELPDADEPVALVTDSRQRLSELAGVLCLLLAEERHLDNGNVRPLPKNDLERDCGQLLGERETHQRRRCQVRAS